MYVLGLYCRHSVELYILDMIGQFDYSELQLGFAQRRSTQMASVLTNYVISYCTSRGSVIQCDIIVHNYRTHSRTTNNSIFVFYHCYIFVWYTQVTFNFCICFMNTLKLKLDPLSARAVLTMKGRLTCSCTYYLSQYS